jgi:hypothetical protein
LIDAITRQVAYDHFIRPVGQLNQAPGHATMDHETN